MRQLLHFALWIGLVAVFAAPLAATDPIALQLQLQQPEPPIVTRVAEPQVTPAPLVVQSPGTVEIEIKIKPTADTEELRITAESGNHYRSSTIWLTGAESQKVHTFEWHGFPAGEYEVVGELIASSGRREVVVRGALRVVE
ncbi:MAG: hypothetical protein F4Y45_00025 [Acidobacteria bacterium]|nr:hypothetical protein [Acidobacteriota bacterium]MYJ04713.1 hypothetical protein [Acidobacteriota bacterium]